MSDKNDKFKKVFLDSLPRKGNRIDWKGSVGHDIDFIYGDLQGKLKIKDHYVNTGGQTYIEVQYKDGKSISMQSGELKNCNLREVLRDHLYPFKFEIGESIKDKKRQLVIIDRKKECGRRWYKYLCNNCGFDCGGHYRNGMYKSEYWVTENDLLIHYHGCSCCIGRAVVPEINSIWATDRWMMELGVSEEDAKKFTKCSHEDIKPICPICNTEKKKKTKIIGIYNRKSIGCSCGDGKSYPEKFLAGFFNQLNVSYETEYTSSWSDGKRYDFHINSNNSIIEAHGTQHPGTKHHFISGFTGYGAKARSSQQELENDNYKEKLAKDNGIENYIVIDCSKSDMEFIKNEILNSKLAELYDLSNIDWFECEKFALSNIVKEVCDYWNNKEEWETVTDLSNKFHLNNGTVRKYIKKGVGLNWCDYDSKKELRKNASKNNTKKSKEVEVFRDGLFLGCFDSARELSRISLELFGFDLHVSKISNVCLGKRKQYKGFTFRHKETN